MDKVTQRICSFSVALPLHNASVWVNNWNVLCISCCLFSPGLLLVCVCSEAHTCCLLNESEVLHQLSQVPALGTLWSLFVFHNSLWPALASDS